jgi:L-threonylcarbamoyladenylate synthase
VLTCAESTAIRTLRAGSLIVHATEGVFGIGCSAFNRDACRAVADLKSRGRNKPFIVVAADFVQIASWVRLDLSDFSVDRA